MLFALLYAAATLGLAVYGFNSLLYAILFIWLQFRKPPPGQQPSENFDGEWPTVAVQLPIYNERFVVERLIESVAALDYPADRLSIQVLDDSTDDTAALARARVAQYRARGVDIDYIRRPERTGYKAGALAYGLAQTKADFVAVFDADFAPPPDFLRRVMPHFADERVGLAQARWGHLNAEHSPLTRAQALMLDGHFGVEQTVRSRLGWLWNFNGSAGVWRAACIADAGGWGSDTIAEDLDLSYRAQLRGWEMRFLPDLAAPAEIPTLLGAFKRQQFRWAKGSIQCVRKLGWRLLASRESFMRKTQGLLHITAYLVHPLMLLLMLTSLPVLLTGEISKIHLGAIGLAGFGAPLMFALSQWSLYPDWRKRLYYLPVLILVAAGIAASNTWAILEAVIGRNPTVFLRTPKAGAGLRPAPAYALPVDWTTWVEILFMIYSAVTTVVALERSPGLAPFMAVYTLGFGYTAYLGLKQSLGTKGPMAYGRWHMADSE
ncbi:MAG TPA: glycosyltransferase [Anaerolineales bacterium]|nr:glycosyltransferase [Anaerolineales bacterium]